MKNTIRDQIERFIYPHLEYFTSMVYEGGENTVFKGVRVLDDKEKFTQGALVNAASLLYSYYVKNGDARADNVYKRLLLFIKMSISTDCKTWGKLGILRGLNILYENGLFDVIPKEDIEAIMEKTDYVDFFDKATVETPGKATNYLQVAMACAGYREKFGWENDGFAEIIKRKLASLISEDSENGWMDDEMPYGRYDRYSLVLSSEYFDTATDVGLSIPDSIRSNLKEAADISLFMANRRGDGILYGRSVPCHGDATGAEILASALAGGLVDAQSTKTALAYIHAVTKKLYTIWYDSDSQSFNMWWDGRTTNYYRGMGRVLEVNLDLANHMSTTLKNLERAGLADVEVDLNDIPRPEQWETLSVDFSAKDGEKKLILLRKGDILIALPFVGHGKNWGRRCSYYAFPVIPSVIEASPIADLPFFVPEYTDDEGYIYRPFQYYDKISLNKHEGKIYVNANGYLSSAESNLPEKSQFSFEIKYEFSGDTVNVDFDSDINYKKAEMIIGTVDDLCLIKVKGFDETKSINTDSRDDFSGVHSKIKNATLNISNSRKCLGYSIDFRNCYK